MVSLYQIFRVQFVEGRLRTFTALTQHRELSSDGTLGADTPDGNVTHNGLSRKRLNFNTWQVEPAISVVISALA